MIAAAYTADGPRVEVSRKPRRRRADREDLAVARDVFIAVKAAQGASQARIGGLLRLSQQAVSLRLKEMPPLVRQGAESLAGRFPDGIPEAMMARLEELCREERRREREARQASRLVREAGLPLRS